MSDSDGWISARKTLQVLTAEGQSPAAVADMIFAYLRHGDLRARATKIWKSEERFTSAAWKNEPEEGDSGEIPVRYWRFEKDVEGDRSRFRFPANRFAMTTRLKPRTRIMMRGVKFSLEDLGRLQPRYFGALAGKRKRGRPVELDRRDMGWLQLLEFVVQGRCAAGEFPTQDKLRFAMQIALALPGGKLRTGEKSIQEIVSKAWPLIGPKK